jgi:glycosyltransferase involved in cell wall biosynthesis
MPSLTGRANRDGTIRITRKFHDGAVAMVEHWRGGLRVLLEPSPDETLDLDGFDVDPESLPYELELMDFRSPDVASRLRDASVVLAMVGLQTTHLVSTCRELSIPLVYFAEYTLKTRLQIAGVEEQRTLRRARRWVFEVNQERRNQLAIRAADGVQCNGTPAFDAYRFVNPRAHLFFDTRLRKAAMIDAEQLEARLATLDRARPLSIVFSGRLDAMKGAEHLPRIARELRSLGVDFKLSICGDGELAPEIQRHMRGLGLERQMEMKGVLRFESELVPWLKREADLFFVPHVQGDPSCTYVETFGCGVPMAGFDNEAFRGILQRHAVGWALPMRDARKAAEAIALLDRDREQLKRAARRAREMAEEHSFESMMKGRMDHLRTCMEQARGRITSKRTAM